LNKQLQVSEDMLRLVVNEAQKSEGIQNDEGKMINAVLDLQNTEVWQLVLIYHRIFISFDHSSRLAR
jgi:CBS domain containing-hemolysin-like protein